MIRNIAIVLIGLLILAPVGATAQDSLDALVNDLNLDQVQIDKIQLYFDEFAKKQNQLPTVADEVMQQREVIRQVITGAPFNQNQAQQVSQKISSVVANRIVNRLELRNRIFHVLTPEQQQKYIQYVQQKGQAWE